MEKSHGVYYDPVKDDLKVVVISPVIWTYAVYSYKHNAWSGTRQWRHGYLNERPGVHIDGKLYWLSYDKKLKPLDIIYYDPREHDVVELRMEARDFYGYTGMLCDLRGHLCLCDFSIDDDQVRIQMTKNPISWEKIESVKTEPFEIRNIRDEYYEKRRVRNLISALAKSYMSRAVAREYRTFNFKPELDQQALVPSLCNLLFPLRRHGAA